MVETDADETDAVVVVDEIVIVGAIDKVDDADDAIVARVEIIVEGFVDTALVVEAEAVLSLFKQLYFVKFFCSINCKPIDFFKNPATTLGSYCLAGQKLSFFKNSNL